MKNEFDVSTLFRYAFSTARGLVLNYDPESKKPFDASKAEENKITEAADFEDLPEVDSSEDEFGTMRDTLGSNLPDGRPVFMPIKLGGLLLPNEPTINITRKKIIKSTPLTGITRKGTVKELIGFDDIQITIRGIALNYNNINVYPEKMVKDLDDLAQLPQTLEIQSGLTSLLGIYRLIIVKVNYPEMIGVQHAQAYEFQCISDEDFILEL